MRYQICGVFSRKSIIGEFTPHTICITPYIDTGYLKKKLFNITYIYQKFFFPINFRLGTLDKSIVTKQARNSGKSLKKSG